MKKVTHYSHRLNVMISKEDYAILQSIKSRYGKSAGKLVRESIHFYNLYYKDEAPAPVSV